MMKLKIHSFFILLFTFQSLFAQKKHHSLDLPYSCTWKNIILNSSYSPSLQDTAIFVVSTRNCDIKNKEFVDYDYDTTARLTYFIVYFSGNNWTTVPYSSFSEMMDVKKEKKDLVVFAEGLGKTFPSGIDRTTKLIREYHVDAIYFDWPTDRPYATQGKNFRTTLSISENVAVPYAAFLKEFEQYKINHPEKFKTVTLFFHSMGNLILMHALKKDLFANISSHFVDNLILNAACVNQKNHKQWLEKCTISNHIYLTINKHDRNLNGAKIILFRHQLGERPKPEFCKNVKYVNFSKILKKEHNYFLMQPILSQKPELKEFYMSVFNGTINY